MLFVVKHIQRTSRVNSQKRQTTVKEMWTFNTRFLQGFVSYSKHTADLWKIASPAFDWTDPRRRVASKSAAHTNQKTNPNNPKHRGRKKATRAYDKSVPAHQPTDSIFRPGQIVAIQNHVTSEWSRRGRIVSYQHPRSYVLKMIDSQQIVSRNQRFLRWVYSLAVSGFFGDSNAGRIWGNRTDINPTVGTDSASDAKIPFNEDDRHSDENDTDSDTIPFTGEETEQYSRFGRLIKRKIPIDYEDI